MKPSRLQNVLKSFGRAPKCIKILWPDPKIHEILENVGSGLPKIAKIYENPKNVIFSSQNRKNFDHWDGKIDSELPLKKKRNDSVLKFPRPVGIFKSDLFRKWGSNHLSANSEKNNWNIKNTWKSRKSKNSIKTNK